MKVKPLVEFDAWGYQMEPVDYEVTDSYQSESGVIKVIRRYDRLPHPTREGFYYWHVKEIDLLVLR